jgi:FixJ family two-component response regulator
LLTHQGLANSRIADQLQISRPTVNALRAAFVEDGMSAVAGIGHRNAAFKADAGDRSELP